MKSQYKFESLYLLQVVRLRRSIKPLPRGWKYQYLFLTISLYLFLDVVLTAILSPFLYTLFPSYFDLYNEIEIEYLFLSAVIIAPFLEELLFRLPMVYNQKRLKWWFFLLALTLFSIHWSIGIASLVFSFYVLNKELDKIRGFNLKEWHKKNSKNIFWILSISFGLMHVTSFDLDQLPLYAYPIVVATQILGGIMLGLVRIRFGLRYAIISHATFNFILYLLTMLS